MLTKTFTCSCARWHDDHSTHSTGHTTCTARCPGRCCNRDLKQRALACHGQCLCTDIATDKLHAKSEKKRGTSGSRLLSLNPAGASNGPMGQGIGESVSECVYSKGRRAIAMRAACGECGVWTALNEEGEYGECRDCGVWTALGMVVRFGICRDFGVWTALGMVVRLGNCGDCGVWTTERCSGMGMPGIVVGGQRQKGVGDGGNAGRVRR